MNRYTSCFFVLASAAILFSGSAAYAGGGWSIGGVAQQNPMQIGGVAQQNPNPMQVGGVAQQNPIKIGGTVSMSSGSLSSSSGSPSDGAATATAVLRLACVVSGTPAAFPNDVWLTNRGKEVLPKGTKVKFEVPSTGYRSALMLKKALAAGMQVKVVDVITGGAEPGAACNAKLL